jgi:orotate phosphoribosyltransferase-like protein
MNLRNAGKTDDEIATEMNCSRQTVYRKIGAKNPKVKK